MTTSGIVICILIALLGISLLVNLWCIGYAEKIEDYYLDWIYELERRAAELWNRRANDV